MHQVEPVHLAMVVSFVLVLGPDPYLILEILWLLLAAGFYLTHQGHDNGWFKEGNGGTVR